MRAPAAGWPRRRPRSSAKRLGLRATAARRRRVAILSSIRGLQASASPERCASNPVEGSKEGRDRRARDEDDRVGPGSSSRPRRLRHPGAGRRSHPDPSGWPTGRRRRKSSRELCDGGCGGRRKAARRAAIRKSAAWASFLETSLGESRGRPEVMESCWPPRRMALCAW